MEIPTEMENSRFCVQYQYQYEPFLNPIKLWEKYTETAKAIIYEGQHQ